MYGRAVAKSVFADSTGVDDMFRVVLRWMLRELNACRPFARISYSTCTAEIIVVADPTLQALKTYLNVAHTSTVNTLFDTCLVPYSFIVH